MVPCMLVLVSNAINPLTNLTGVSLHSITGPHPSGNVSTQIAKIDPINKGETVWIVSPQDLVIIGELLVSGKFNAARTVALTGSKIIRPQYVEAIIGEKIEDLTKDNLDEQNERIISGNVLSGTQVMKEGFLGFYDNQVTAIPEGDDYEFFEWNKPIFNKISKIKGIDFFMVKSEENNTI